MHKNMREMEQYGDTFVIKGVYKGERSEAVLLFLNPGQEMPSHPHERFEVVLLPQTGQGLLTVDGTKAVQLVPQTLYYESAGHTFHIRNTGDEPMQVLITLVQVADPPVSHANALEGDKIEITENHGYQADYYEQGSYFRCEITGSNQTDSGSGQGGTREEAFDNAFVPFRAHRESRENAHVERNRNQRGESRDRWGESSDLEVG